MDALWGVASPIQQSCKTTDIIESNCQDVDHAIIGAYACTGRVGEAFDLAWKPWPSDICQTRRWMWWNCC